ncbi:enoyl-CoA hydratase/isomerase family protein [Kineosporia babensis]|uniref:Enoyl-CoA hydratase-related protein n=1 Tax=Kineosporia babensis TaxID=499548 RepID=A0A9X1SXT6_9ACTN|nr:enoyl-CoA hydratase-related protein [Kineosporia babensis]MCD5315565.1 enoyl-CoA hydratase-related protein [Kineosporia babensis]
MVLQEREGAVTVLTLNRPQRRNALDADSKKALRRAVEEVAADESVRAVVLTGAGGSFCGGQDLAEHAEALRTDPATAFATVEQDYAPIVQALITMPKPVIAAVEGTCVGAGLALALACDLRIMAEDAVLGTAFTAIGLTCDSGLSLTLTQSVGPSRAKELLLLGQSFSPAEAGTWGIAGRIVPTGQVQQHARETAARLAAGPTLAYAETKKLIDTAALTTVLHNEALAQARLGLSTDHRAAVEAFLAKRRPSFEGR